MKKTLIILVLGFLSNNVMASLPSATKTPQRQPFNQGLGAGADYYNQQLILQQQQQQQQQLQNYQRAQKIGQTVQTGGDLLYLFTGSEGTVRDQVHSGFRSNSQTTFWNRLWSILGGAAWNRFGTPLENKLGILENRVSNPAAYYQQPRPQNPTVCHDCVGRQNAHTQKLDPALFGGNKSSATTKTTTPAATTNPANTGGIRK